MACQRAGAVEDIGEAAGRHRALAALCAMVDFDAVPSRAQSLRFARPRPRSRPAAIRSTSKRRDLRRDAVPVDVPPWPRVAKEAALLAGAERLPQRLAVRPQAVDRCPPADLGAPGAGASAAAPARAHAAPRRARPARLASRVAARDQPAPRHGEDRARHALRIERKHDVDHGQAGADDQHRRVARRGVGNRLRAPRRSTDWRSAGRRRRRAREPRRAAGCRSQAPARRRATVLRLRARSSSRHRRAPRAIARLARIR